MPHILICTFITIVLALLLSGKTKNVFSRALFVFIFSLITTPIFYFITALGISSCATNVTYTPFNKEKWLSDKSNRYRYSLFSDGTLIKGKSPSEVIELLGLPDNEHKDLFQYNLISEDNWRSKYGFNPWLNIEFKNGKASNYYIVSD